MNVALCTSFCVQRHIHTLTGTLAPQRTMPTRRKGHPGPRSTTPAIVRADLVGVLVAGQPAGVSPGGSPGQPAPSAAMAAEIPRAVRLSRGPLRAAAAAGT